MRSLLLGPFNIIVHTIINFRMILPEEDFGTQMQHMIFGNPSFFSEYKQLATDDHAFFRGIALSHQL